MTEPLDRADDDEVVESKADRKARKKREKEEKKQQKARQREAKKQASDSDQAALAGSGAVASGPDDVGPRESQQRESRPRRQREPRKRALWPRLLAWFLFVFVIMAIVAGGYKYRGEIVSRWPASAKIYGALGIDVTPPKGTGLVVPEGSVRISRSSDGDIPTLIIAGDIENRAKLPQQVSEMQITLVDKEGKTLKTWTFQPETRMLRPGGSMSFRTSVRRPPPDAVKVTFSFDKAKATAE